MDKKKVATTIASLTIITIMTISTINPNNYDSEFVVSFSVTCDKSQIYQGDKVNCGVENIEYSEFFIWNFHDGSDLLVKQVPDNGVSHIFNSSGTYQITIVGYNSLNLSRIEVFEVQVNSKFPSVNIEANSTTIFEDEPVKLTALTEGNVEVDTLSYLWELGDKTTKYGSEITHSFENAGEYIVKLIATDESGLTHTEFQNITVVNFSPIANPITYIFTETFNDGSIDAIKSTGTIAHEDQLIEFDASESVDTISDISNLKFLWAFGDGSYSNKMVVNHTYGISGAYSVQLNVSDDDGLIHSQEIDLTISNVDPTIDSIDPQAVSFDEGQTVFIKAQVNETSTDYAQLDYSWETTNGYKAGWLSTITAYNNGPQDASASVTDNDNSGSESEVQLISNNVDPIPSLQQIFSAYNISFAIMGTKGHSVNITLSSDLDTILFAYLQREPQSPWDHNVTFAYLNQDLREHWKVEILYAPEEGDNGANPVTALMYFENVNDNYTLKHTFNVQQPQTYNWTFYIDPILWGFPLDFKYHVFDPGSDSGTIVTDIDGDLYDSDYINESGLATNAVVWDKIRAFNLTQESVIQYYAIDEDGGTSEVYQLNLSHTLLSDNSNSSIIVDFYAPVFTIQIPESVFEDELISFESEYLTPRFSNDSSQLNYIWHFGDLSISNEVKPTHFFENEGQYLVWLEVSNANFKYATGLWLTVKNKIPVAEITPLPTNIYEDDKLFFDVLNLQESLSDRFSLNYFWEFSTGFTSTQKSFWYSFPSSGSYQITLTIIDDQGASTTIEETIVIRNSRPKILDNIANVNTKEGDTLILEAEFSDSILDKSNLKYVWNISNQEYENIQTSQTGQISSWFLDSGEYIGTVTVSDGDSTTTLEFVVTINQEIIFLSTSDYTFYGNTTGSILLSSTISGSYFDHKRIETSSGDSNSEIEYCFANPEQNSHEFFEQGEEDCQWLSATEDHFYTNITTTSLSSYNYNIKSKIRDLQAGVSENTQDVQEFQYVSEIHILQDTDGDELPDQLEIMAGTNALNPDTDGDNIADPFETAIYLDSPAAQYAEYTKLFYGTSPDNFDSDNDGLPDGYLNGYGELISGTNPLNNDTDNDGLLDGIEVMGWEITVTIDGVTQTKKIHTNPFISDTDGDGLSDSVEHGLKSNALLNDSDCDGLDDKREREIGTSLVDDDTDDDGLDDLDEIEGYALTWYDRDDLQVNTTVFSDPWRNDTDEDGLLDGEEFMRNTNAASKDTDQDGLTDDVELSLEQPTIPYMAHTDDDGLFDGLEVLGWNITTYIITGAQYNEYGNVTIIQPVYTNVTELVTSDPWKIDTDGDFISDGDELLPPSVNGVTNSYKTSNPRKLDSDNDGILDSEDRIPLMTEYQPPEINSDLLLEYKIPVLSIIQDVVDVFTGTLDVIEDLIRGVTDLRNDLWDLISDDPLGDISSRIDNFVEGLSIQWVEDNHGTDRSYLGDTIELQNFAASITPDYEWISKSRDFFLNIISGDFSISEAWDRVKSKLWDAVGILIDYAKDLARDFAENWIENSAGDGAEKDGSNWITFETPDVDIDWKHCGKWKFRVICGIDDVDISGGFKINFKIEEIIGMLDFSFFGDFIIEFVEGAIQAFGVLAPELTLEFDVYDASGIEKVELWVNSNPNTNNPNYVQSFNGAKSGHFQWRSDYDLTDGCLPPDYGENGNGNGNGSGGGTGGGGGRYPRVLVEGGTGTIQTLSQSESIIMTTASETCDSDYIHGADYDILLTDVNGNQRWVERSKAGFAVELANKVYEIVEQVFEWVGDVIEWIADTVVDIFEQGQQILEDVAEGIETIVNTAIELLDAAFRWIWENFVRETILTLKSQYYDPAKEFANQSLQIIDHGQNQLLADLTGEALSNSANETMRDFEPVMDTIQEVVEPVANIANAVSDFIGILFENLGVVGDLLEIVIEAIQKLGEYAMEVVMEVVSSIIKGIIKSLLSGHLDEILNYLDQYVNDFSQLSSSLGDEYSNLHINFEVEELETIDFINPLSSLGLLLNLFGEIDGFVDIYNTGMKGLISTLPILLNMLTGASGFNIGGESLGSFLLTPLMSVLFVITDIFGFDRDDLPTLPSSTGLQLTQTPREHFDNVTFFGFILTMLGVISEILAGIKETTKDKNSKLAISSWRLVISITSLGINEWRKSYIADISGGTYVFNGFADRNVRIGLMTTAGSWVRDFIEAKLQVPENVKIIANSILYFVTSGGYLYKFSQDYHNLQDPNKAKYGFQTPAYIISMVENFAKFWRDQFKGIINLGKIGGASEGLKSFSDKFAQKEASIRIKFLTILDFIEDFLNIILYDASELGWI